MSDPDFLDIKYDRDTLKARSARGAAATLVGQGIKFVLRFGSTIVLARLLAPAEFGVMAMVAPIVAFMGAVNEGGFAQAIVQRQNLRSEEVSALFWINLAISVALALLLLAGAPLAGLAYREPEAPRVLAAMSALLVLDTLALIPRAILSRQMRFVAQTSIELASIALSVAITIVAAWWGLSYWSLVVGQLCGSLSWAVLAFVVAGWRPSRPARVAGVGELARFGANLTGVNLATFFSTTADNIIIGAAAGKAALGLYDRSYNLVVQPLAQLTAPLSRVALPLLSRVREDPALYRRTYAQMLKLTLLLTAPAMVFCVVLARPLILFLWGERWAPAVPIFAWICVGGLVAPMFTTNAWLFTSEGRTSRQLALAVATSLISIASFGVGILWGAVGVARTNALTFTLIQTPLMMWAATSGGLVKPSDVLGAIAPLCAAGVVAAAVLLLLAPHLSGWWLIPALGVGYAVFGATVLLLPGGRALLQTTWRLAGSLRGRKPAVAAS